MLKLAEFPTGFNITPVADRLREAGIDHRFVIEEGNTVLYIADEVPPQQAVDIIRSALEQTNSGGKQDLVGAVINQFRRTPVTMVSLLLCLLGTLIPMFYFPLVPWLTIQHVTLVSETQAVFSSLPEDLAKGQVWRLITPIFLHFNEFHLIFNGLWLWEFGRRVEVVAGSRHLLMLMMAIGVISNVSQYAWEGPGILGGMSGVDAGLLGYLWIRNFMAPHPVLALPRGLVTIMLVLMLVQVSGVMSLFMEGSVANMAHGAGLAVGMVLGATAGWINRRRWRA